MLTYVKILILLIAVFLVKPSALGQSLTSIGIGLSVLSLSLHFMEFSKRKIRLTKKNFIVSLSVLSLWTYLLAHASILGSNHLDFVIKAYLAHVVLVICGAIVLSDRKSNFLFFRYFILSLVGSSLSYWITYTLSLILGLDKLYLFTLPIEGYDGSGSIYLPFTILYGLFSVGDIQLPRLLGLFRESGILQAFLVWAYFNLKNYNLEYKWIKMLIILGIIGTFSTSGIAVFLGTIVIYLIANKKPLRGTLISLAMLLALFFTPYIGLKNKAETHGDSINDRMYATISGLEKLKEHPIGEGLYQLNYNDLPNSGINLLAISYKIGILGFILVLIMYFLPLYKYEYKKNYIVSIFPLFITMLTSQPLLDAPLVLMIFLAVYDSKNRVREKVKAKRKIKFRVPNDSKVAIPNQQQYFN
ncbi:O-antigen ligase family protein [Priestia megaterium]|uniref:O-antigen ligase family protein n=1 Tax=Priestia megaterium TaxID=1404 RepID=UPI003D078CB3